MNDEIELTEMPAEAPQGGFRAAMASIKKIEKRFSLDGKASMGEYWVTFLLRWLPLALVSGGLMYAAGLSDLSALATSDKKVISFLVTTGWLGIQILIPALFTLANLEMFPVTVRRLRDAKVCVGLAAFMIPAVVFFTAVAAVYPWLVCISALILLVPGILPSKAGADDANAAGVVTKTKMCYLAAVLFIISAAALGIATESLILRFGVEKMAKKYSKENGDSSADKESGKGSASGSREVTNSEGKDDYVSYYEKWLREYVRNTEASTGHQLGENYVQKQLREFKQMTPKEQKEQIELMKSVLQR